MTEMRWTADRDYSIEDSDVLVACFFAMRWARGNACSPTGAGRTLPTAARGGLVRGNWDLIREFLGEAE